MNKLSFNLKKNLEAGARKSMFSLTGKQYMGFMGSAMILNGVSGLAELINQIIFYQTNPELLSLKYNNYNNPSGHIFTRFGKDMYTSSIAMGGPYL